MDIPADRLARYTGPEWLQRTLHEWEMSTLLPTLPDGSVVTTSKKRELSVPDVQLSSAAEVAAETARVSKQLRISNGGRATDTVAVVAEKCIDNWFTTFDAEGRAGNIGLVPEPLRELYPRRAPTTLDANVRAYVQHFYAFIRRCDE